MAMIYCRECGAKHSDRAKACPKCGYVEYDLNKSVIVYFLLLWFVGLLGAHRFYAGKTASAVVMLVLTLSVFGIVITGIWWLIDLIYAICNLGKPENLFEKK